MTENMEIFGIEDDPVLGKYVSHYPGDRMRLLIIGGAVLAVVWFVITVLLWSVEDDGLAATITVIIIAAATLGVGWYVAHLWNREVILYMAGFSYREGSRVAFLQYNEIRSIRQRAERISYFGGLIRRTIFEIYIITAQDEHITLGNFYRRIDEMSLQLENRITEALLERTKTQLQGGEQVRFTDDLAVSAEGLQYGADRLAWNDATTPTIENRHIVIRTQDGDSWFRAPIKDVPNARLLLALFHEYTTREDVAS